MAKNSIRDFDATSGNNTDIQSVDISEGCAASGINNALRELMTDLKNVSTGAVNLETPAADSLTVAGDLTVDTNTLKVDSSNNRLGIGTASPGVKFELNNGGAGSMMTITDGVSTNFNFSTSGTVGSFGTDAGSTSLALKTSGSEKVRITSGGFVGINAASPVGRLQVGGSTANSDNKLVFGKSVTTSQSFLPVIQQASHDGAGSDLALGATSTSGKVRFFTGASNATATLGAGSNAERMTIDASGKVGIGLSSNIDRALHVQVDADYAVKFGGTSAGDYAIEIGQDGGGGSPGFNATGPGAAMKFSMGGTEAMRVDTSGRLLINRSSPSTVNPHSKLHVLADSAVSAATIQIGTNGYAGMSFLNASGSDVGSIVINASSTAYNTSSDYRLKENIVDMTGAIDRVKALAPKRFNFIADADTTVDGFLAHEAQAVVPEAVTGTKDEVDDDGNAVMQGIDQSKLVPLLTGALQEAIAKIEALETEMTALKARVTALEA